MRTFLNGSLSSPAKRLTLLHNHLHYHFRNQTTRPYSSPTKSFTYALSAAYSAKNDRLNLPSNSYFHNPPSTPSPLPSPTLPLKQRIPLRPKSGQDAFFISTLAPSSTLAFGVVDGVGGWQDSGVDSAHFSHGLCEYMTSFAASPQKQELRPTELLDLAYEAVLEDKSIYAGGSTACVGTAKKDGTVEVANLGDSGYAHLSPLRLSHLSTAQQHEFNTPFQLSKVPAPMRKQLALFGGGHHGERPKDADTYSHIVEHGDILVFATDGVWDNLSPEDVMTIVSSEMVKMSAWVLPEDGKGAVSIGKELARIASPESKEGGKAEISTVIARAIVRDAKHASENSRRDGPFAKEIKRRFPWENYSGGKVDDICCIVGVVLEDGL